MAVPAQIRRANLRARVLLQVQPVHVFVSAVIVRVHELVRQHVLHVRSARDVVVADHDARVRAEPAEDGLVAAIHLEKVSVDCAPRLLHGLHLRGGGGVRRGGSDDGRGASERFCVCVCGEGGRRGLDAIPSSLFRSLAREGGSLDDARAHHVLDEAHVLAAVVELALRLLGRHALSRVRGFARGGRGRGGGGRGRRDRDRAARARV